MTDQEHIVDALARANERYMVTVTDEQTSVLVTGSRSRGPRRAGPKHPSQDVQPVEFLFTPEGALVSVRAQE